MTPLNHVHACHGDNNLKRTSVCVCIYLPLLIAVEVLIIVGYRIDVSDHIYMHASVIHMM